MPRLDFSEAGAGVGAALRGGGGWAGAAGCSSLIFPIRSGSGGRSFVKRRVAIETSSYVMFYNTLYIFSTQSSLLDSNRNFPEFLRFLTIILLFLNSIYEFEAFLRKPLFSAYSQMP
jgi:hypothetical protein